MRIFVYEYTCATGAAPSLQAEGWAMLRCVTEDLAAAGMQPVTLLAPSFAHQPTAECRRIGCAEEEPAFRELARRSDFCLLIAPESGGLLAERCRWVTEAGGRLLGPEADVVAAVADKLGFSDSLRQRGVPSPRILQLLQTPNVGQAGLRARLALRPDRCR